MEIQGSVSKETTVLLSRQAKKKNLALLSSEFQFGFSSMLRTPLVTSGGTGSQKAETKDRRAPKDFVRTKNPTNKSFNDHTCSIMTKYNQNLYIDWNSTQNCYVIIFAILSRKFVHLSIFGISSDTVAVSYFLKKCCSNIVSGRTMQGN